MRAQSSEVTSTSVLSAVLDQLRHPVIKALAGVCLFAACILTVLIGFSVITRSESVGLLLGGLIGVAGVLLFPSLRTTQRWQVLVLCLIAVALVWISSEALWGNLPAALSTNSGLIALIVSVSFLRLVVRSASCSAALPQSARAMWQSIFGLHFLSAVINLPAITIFGDRMQGKAGLKPGQYMMLSRTFGADAMWSPFFAAMGAALAYATGASLYLLMAAGFVCALSSMLITGWQCGRRDRVLDEPFVSYPMSFRNLLLPLVLCVLVIGGHQIFPDVSILILVAAVVLLTVLVMLVIQARAATPAIVVKHVQQGIPQAASEILLFTSAGILVLGVSAFYHAGGIQLPFDHFSGPIACACLIGMVGMSCLGVHPLISISVMGELLAPLDPPHNVLGVLFLLAWGVSLPVSPLSGVNLVMQSRYGVAPLDAFRYNAFFTVLMLAIGCIVLLTVSAIG